MNNTDLEVFLTIIQAKSISGAANVLFLSPSAIGARLKALEDELGFSLFFTEKGLQNDPAHGKKERLSSPMQSSG